ncbi:MAG TPA: glycosyltransferase family 2 protein [Burkholderiaceae bacterium]|jgi:glycosyltransferase involved in cell wall biosynthesis
MRISICICTFKRPEGLRKALESIAALTMPADCELDALVVDNDAAGSARELVLSLQGGFPLPLRYECEARNGVGYARAHCLHASSGSWIAFIDDDEWAERDWLSALVATARATQADAVFGPVPPAYRQVMDQTLLALSYFERPRFPTGTRLNWQQCATGNVLFKRQLYLDVGGFKADFSVSGGEDSEFFSRCERHGAKLIWCDEAVANEDIPPERATRRWILQRAYIGGNNFARMRRARGGWPAYAPDALRGMFGFAAFGFAALLARLMRSPRQLALECKAATGLGKLTAMAMAPGNSYGGRDSDHG